LTDLAEEFERDWTEFFWMFSEVGEKAMLASGKAVWKGGCK
jgi:hypothetical protein